MILRLFKSLKELIIYCYQRIFSITHLLVSVESICIDNDIKINVALANKSPIGVDTKEDYLAIKNIMKYK